MLPVERAIRVFGAGFGVSPRGASWLRARAHELGKLSEVVTVLVVWGPLRFTVRRLPERAPEFAIRRADGSIERPPAP